MIHLSVSYCPATLQDFPDLRAAYFAYYYAISTCSFSFRPNWSFWFEAPKNLGKGHMERQIDRKVTPPPYKYLLITYIEKSDSFYKIPKKKVLPCWRPESPGCKSPNLTFPPFFLSAQTPHSDERATYSYRYNVWVKWIWQWKILRHQMIWHKLSSIKMSTY